MGEIIGRDNLKSKSKIEIPFMIFVIIYSIIWSILCRVFSFLDLPQNQKLFLIFILIIFVILFTYIIRKHFAQTFINFLSSIKKKLIIYIIISIVSTIIIMLLPFYRLPYLPYLHTIEINPSGDDNIIYILKVEKQIKKSFFTSEYIYIYPDEMKFDGKYLIYPDGKISLESGATLSYTSFFTGCYQISFVTAPESKLVEIKLNNSNDNDLFNLNNKKNKIFIQELCSNSDFVENDFLWKLIIISIYLSDFNIIFLIIFLTLFTFILFKDKNNIYKNIVFIFLSITISITMFLNIIFISNPNIDKPTEFIKVNSGSIKSVFYDQYNTMHISQRVLFLLISNYFPNMRIIYLDKDIVDICNLDTKWAFYTISLSVIPSSNEDISIDKMISAIKWTKVENKNLPKKCSNFYFSQEDDTKGFGIMYQGIIYIISQNELERIFDH